MVPKEGSASSSSAAGQKKDKTGKTDKSSQDEQGDGQPEQSPEDEKDKASSLPEVDPEQEAQRLLEERIGELCFYYTGNFDMPDAPNTAQVYWSVFKWYALGRDYKPPEKPDYTGYEQLDMKTVRRLIERWYGPDIPEYEGNLSALGDPATGELINVSENGNTCYFLEVEMPMEETYILQNARVDENGILTMRFNAQDSSGGYLRTYLCKLKPDKKGGYYLCSLNKGQS
ncbi:MAG: hypothetical protein HFG27_09780 [Provencibacterium sp.]|nr:hypothetical protein [Provencibacterium sp.]